MSRGAARRPAGLFRRIFATFVVTAVLSATVSAIAAYAFGTRYSSEWMEDTMAIIDPHIDAIERALIDLDDTTLAAEVDAIARTLDHPVGVYGRRGRRLAGGGPPDLPQEARRFRHAARHGRPVVFRESPLFEPGLAVGLNADGGRPVAVLVVFPSGQPRIGLPLFTLGLLVALLGVGAWLLSRSLAQRLGRLETSARRISDGELAHRVAVPEEAVDEIDQLGIAFNEMATRVQALLLGQRTLLANVSHELRTPIARVKVLLEILQERSAALPPEDRHAVRVQQGLREMSEDVTEIESLISDLLTSGRLQLGQDAPLQLEPIALAPMLGKLGGRVDAQIDVDDDLQLVADPLLLARLVSNLLANARRAGPEGSVQLQARGVDDVVELRVVDEGPGVPHDQREAIFEPFRRLDPARDRDRGGVGLGLHLCKQICAAHGGTIAVGDRPDRAPGACFIVRLPRHGPTRRAR